MPCKREDTTQRSWRTLCSGEEHNIKYNHYNTVSAKVGTVGEGRKEHKS